MQVKFELIVDTDDGMGFDTPEIIQSHIEEAIRDTGDSGISVKLTLIEPPWQPVSRPDKDLYRL